MAEAVFSQELLREMIINYAIHTGDGENVCRDSLCAVRLVQKSWLQTSSKQLRKFRESLYELTLNKDNSLNGAPFVQEEGKILDQFHNRMNLASTVDNILPTFGLKISEECFRQENYKSILHCLTLYGGHLVKLKINVPLNGGSLICVFPSLNLPILEKITVHLSSNRLEDLNEGEAIAEHSYNVTHLINSLLNAATSLNELIVPPKIEWEILPPGFEYTTIPQSLVKLDIGRELKTAHLNVLLMNHLPNLTTLRLLITNLPIGDDLLLRVLENFRLTLKYLVLNGIWDISPPRNVTFIRFPVVESLELLTMNSTHCELDPNLPPLANCFPNLEGLCFTNQTVTNFRTLIEKSKFESVDYLKLQLVNENQERWNEIEFQRSLDQREMQSVHITFPNLRMLTLIISKRETGGLKYLFMEMKLLESLDIVVVGGEALQMHQDFWDPLLIGAPVEFVMALRAAPTSFRESIQIGTSDIPSINMLTELTYLSLGTQSAPDPSPQAQEPVLSDLAFHFALMKMPKLRQLELRGRFMASESIAEEWRNDGRSLIYN